RTFSPTYGL
nr:Chain C, Synemin [Homo sapiens]6EWO_G Chain G, Synemin [Homo sapiens]